MLELLRDSAWNFLAVVIGLVTLIAPMFQRRRKGLSYEVVYQTTLSKVEQNARDYIKFFFGGQPAGNVDFIVIKITNSGASHITPDDYHTPIKISFGEADVLAAEIDQTYPPNIPVSVKLDKPKNNVAEGVDLVHNWAKSVVVEPVMLNVKDSVEIKVWLSDYSGVINVDGRIIGVKQIQKAFKPRLSLLEGFVSVLLASYLIVFLTKKGVYLYIENSTFFGMIILALASLPYWSLMISMTTVKKLTRTGFILTILVALVNLILGFYFS